MEIPKLKVNTIFGFNFYDTRLVDCIIEKLLINIATLEGDLTATKKTLGKNLIQIANLNTALVNTECELKHLKTHRVLCIKICIVQFLLVIVATLLGFINYEIF